MAYSKATPSINVLIDFKLIPVIINFVISKETDPMNLPPSLPQSLFFLILFVPCCTLVAQDLEIAKAGDFGDTSYVCVEREDGTRQIIFTNKKDEDNSLNQKKTNRNIRKKLRRIAANKLRVQENVQNPARKRRRLRALNQKKKELKHIQSKSRDCFDFTLPLTRTDESGFYEIQIPLDAIPQNIDLNTIQLNVDEIPELDFMTEPFAGFSLEPAGLELNGTGVFYFRIDPDTESSIDMPVYTVPMVINEGALNEEPTRDPAEPVSSEPAGLDKGEKTGIDRFFDRLEAQREFTKFTRIFFGRVPSSISGPFYHKDLTPKFAVVGEQFNAKLTAEKNPGVQFLQYTNKSNTLTFKKEVITAMPFRCKGFFESLSRHIIETDRFPFIGDTIGDALEFTHSYTCVKSGKGKIAYSASCEVPVDDLARNEDGSHFFNFKGTALVQCLEDTPESKDQEQTILAPTGSQVKQVFFAVFIDSGATVLDSSIVNTNDEDGDLVPGADTTSVEQITIEDLPVDLQDDFAPPSGKKAIIMQLTITGGNGDSHPLKLSVTYLP